MATLVECGLGVVFQYPILQLVNLEGLLGLGWEASFWTRARSFGSWWGTWSGDGANLGFSLWG